MEEAVEWCRGSAPYALHVDSGMNRLGLQPGALPEFAAALADGTLRKPALLMSHLAEADEPASDYNATQLAAFEAARKQLRLAGVPASLANSGGCLLGPAYHFDVLRPGYGLYGGHLHRAQANPGKPVVELYARIIEAKQVPAGAPISYSRTQRLMKDSRIATVSIGYADGLLRTGSGGQARPGTVLYYDNQPCPVIGRITMDLVMVDVSGTPATRGEWVEVLGPNRPVDQAGDEAGTIGYEILTSLSHRATRHYIH